MLQESYVILLLITIVAKMGTTTNIFFINKNK
jgi:hypothetical protein